MNINFLLPLIVFAVFSCGTPGPNTLKLAFCSANFGFRRTIPYSNGIIIGRILLQITVIFFVGALFVTFPMSHTILKILGSVYLVYLAYKISIVNPLKQSENNKPLTFTQAAIFQFVNPKVWANATTAVSVYIPVTTDYYIHALILIIIFAIISLFANFIWMLCGIQIGKLLSSALSRRIFNLTMAALCASSIVLVWL